jgi:hypothetical protein
MEKRKRHERCPYFKKVVMVLCEASPVKKMLPLEGMTTPSHCLGKFNECPFFDEIPAGMHFPLAKKTSNPGFDAER